MEFSELHIFETIHPNKEAENRFDNLIGIDSHKKILLDTLTYLLDKSKIDSWLKKHHPKGLKFFINNIKDPLVILSGEVGCGKTELANTVCTPLAKILDKRITLFETPSNIRGIGHVGELSARITESFESVLSKVSASNYAILIIDEGDDLATSRSQNQAHHEDRAGLNVLIKQIDLIKRSSKNIVVILITNREQVLDPAFLRRATLHLKFERPNEENRTKVFKYIFQDVKLSEDVLKSLLKASERKIPFSYSDLINRVGVQALYKAISDNKSFNPASYLEILKKTEPTPLIS